MMNLLISVCDCCFHFPSIWKSFMMNRKKERNWRYFSIGSKSELECDMVNIIYLSLLHLLTMMTASMSRKNSPPASVAAYIWCASIPSLALWLGWIAIALILDRELYLIIKGENKLFSSSICLEFESRDTLITYFLPKSWPSVTWVVYFFWNFKNLLHILHTSNTSQTLHDIDSAAVRLRAPAAGAGLHAAAAGVQAGPQLRLLPRLQVTTRPGMSRFRVNIYLISNCIYISIYSLPKELWPLQVFLDCDVHIFPR